MAKQNTAPTQSETQNPVETQIEALQAELAGAQAENEKLCAENAALTADHAALLSQLEAASAQVSPVVESKRISVKTADAKDFWRGGVLFGAEAVIVDQADIGEEAFARILAEPRLIREAAE